MGPSSRVVIAAPCFDTPTGSSFGFAVAAFVATLTPAGGASAQSAARTPNTYTIEQAVAEAVARHPRIRVALAEEAAADARVDDSRTRELPSVGVSAQINRSTGNTPPGAFFPTPGFPPISGAPRGKSFDGGSWQTGAALWATWDVLSFARQAAAVDVALASRSEAAAAESARHLDVGYRAADAFLLLLEAQETVRAAGASVGRAQVLVTMTKPLVDANLRPGADAARADAELASAQMLLARTEQIRDVRRAELAEAIGDASLRVEATPGVLIGPVDNVTAPSFAPSLGHPEIAQADAAVLRAQRAEGQVEVEYLPRLDLVAALWARGSGIYQSPADGFVPDVPNWAVGAVMTWSLLDIPAIRARARVASASYDAALARRDDVTLAVAGQLSTAVAMLEGALRVARQTPVALASARASEQQAIARYKAGLSPVVDVADAERLLAQVEIDDVVARLEARRAQLLLARAAGDLIPFLARVTAGGG